MVWKLFAFSTLAVAARDISTIASTPRLPPLVAGNPSGLEMKEARIEPSWIISGEPKARVAEHSRGADGAGATAIWDCTAGHFRWYFAWDETVVILEGSVHVTDADGNQRLLRAGDIALFRAGTWATWQIDTYVKKIAFLRRPFPMVVANAWRVIKSLRGAGRGTGLGG